ncbi:MAG: HEAT repeat domain-containing protein [Pseudomonadota bacterium]
MTTNKKNHPSWTSIILLSLGLLPLAALTLWAPAADGLQGSIWERLAEQRLAATAGGAYAQQAPEWEGDEESPTDDAQNQWVQGDNDPRSSQERIRRILKAMPTQHDILINVTINEMPGTSDLTRLGRAATPALAKALLNNMNDGVRGVCASVLGEIRDPAAAEALVLALEDAAPEVRYSAVSALGKIGGTGSVDPILALITNPEEENWVKGAAIHTLGRIGDPRSFGLLLKMVHSEEYSGLQGNVVGALWLARGRVKRTKLVNVFVELLRNDEPAATSVISYLGWLQAEAAVDPLADYFVGRSDWVKNSIILAMGQIGSKKARSFLRGVMKNPQKARHLNNAAIALSTMGDEGWVTQTLVDLLADRRVYFRINAAFALGEVGKDNVSAVDALAVALDDPNDFVKSEAAVALGRLKDSRAVPALLKAAQTQNPFVQLDMVIALNRIDYQRHNHLIFEKLLVHEKPRFRRIRERGIRFLAEAGDDRAVPWILESMRDGTYQGWDRAFGMLRDLPKFDHELFAPALLQAVMSQGYSSAGAAALALIRERNIQGLSQFLMETVYHAWLDQKKRLYLTLGTVASPGDIETISRIVEADDAVDLYKDYALASLGQTEALDRLLAVVRDGALGQKRDAAFLLGYLEKPVAREKLLGLLRSEDQLTAINASYALLPHGAEAAYQYLYDVMKSATPAMAQEAERTLRVSPAPGILPFLKSSLADERDLIMKQRLSTLIYEKEPKEFR